MVSSPSENNQDSQNLAQKPPRYPFLQNSNKSVFKTPQKESINQHEEESDAKRDKFNMSKLCMSFLAKYDRDTLPTVFLTRDLVKQFNVKQRRIYDLMNIMQGCACIKKISKGRYEWVGINRTDFQASPSEKGQASSLRQIACQIKKIVFESKARVGFSQIYDVLFQQDSKVREVNPSSLRRRIYECCKVLISLRLIRRVRKDYEWINPDQDSNPLIISTAKTLIRRPRKLPISEDQLIIEIIRRYNSKQELDRLIGKLQHKLFCKQSHQNESNIQAKTIKQEACVQQIEERDNQPTAKKQPIIFQE